MKRTKISELPEDLRKIMRAYIRYWLEDTDAGRGLAGQLSIEEAVDSTCELIDRGLLRCKYLGMRGDRFGFIIEVTPRGRRVRARL